MKKYVERLSDCQDTLTNLYIESVDMSNTHFQYNIFLSCILDRALSVNRGYLSLTESNNYFCAVAMLRMQIENCTRLYGITLVDDTCKYITSWMSGDSNIAACCNSAWRNSGSNLTGTCCANSTWFSANKDKCCVSSAFSNLSTTNRNTCCKDAPGTVGYGTCCNSTYKSQTGLSVCCKNSFSSLSSTDKTT